MIMKHLMQLSPNLTDGSHTKLALTFYFTFKIFLVIASSGSIYLGYKLFILGVTGKASLILESSDVSGQFINAAPGLFFAIGGLISLCIVAYKDINLRA